MKSKSKRGSGTQFTQTDRQSQERQGSLATGYWLLATVKGVKRKRKKERDGTEEQKKRKTRATETMSVCVYVCVYVCLRSDGQGSRRGRYTAFLVVVQEKRGSKEAGQKTGGSENKKKERKRTKKGRQVGCRPPTLIQKRMYVCV